MYKIKVLSRKLFIIGYFFAMLFTAWITDVSASQHNPGGDTLPYQGAHCYEMSNTNISLWIPDGSMPDDVRVRIWWQNLTISKKIYRPLVVKNIIPVGDLEHLRHQRV